MSVPGDRGLKEQLQTIQTELTKTKESLSSLTSKHQRAMLSLNHSNSEQQQQVEEATHELKQTKLQLDELRNLHADCMPAWQKEHNRADCLEDKIGTACKCRCLYCTALFGSACVALDYLLLPAFHCT